MVKNPRTFLQRLNKKQLQTLAHDHKVSTTGTKDQLIKNLLSIEQKGGTKTAKTSNIDECSECNLCTSVKLPKNFKGLTDKVLESLYQQTTLRLKNKCSLCPMCLEKCRKNRNPNCLSERTVVDRFETLAKESMVILQELFKRNLVTKDYLKKEYDGFIELQAEAKKIREVLDKRIDLLVDEEFVML